MGPRQTMATSRKRRIAIIAGVCVSVGTLIALGVAATTGMSSGPSVEPSSGALPVKVRDDARPIEAPVPPAQAPRLAYEVSRLRNTRPVAPRISSGRSRIAGEASLQPDLYAAALVRGLLTQSYVTPRSDLLAWVQAESALTIEPKVVSLIPVEQRSKWAVFSVSQEPNPPVPTTTSWTSLGLRRGHTTVEIQRVTEPVPWSTAVAAGEITDPGVTAREVTALVTLHTTEAGINREIVSSVALSLNLEGPPARATWGFVGAVTYDAVPLSRS